MNTTGTKSTHSAPPVVHGSENDQFQATRVGTIAAGHWIHDSYSGFLSPLLVVFKASLALSNTQAGLLSVIMQEASLLQPLIGGVADRFNVRYFVVLAPAVTGIAMSMLGVAQNYLTLAILLTIAGLSSACLHAIGPVMVGNVSGRKLGLGMSIWMVGGEAGRFFGPVVIGAAITTITLKHVPWLMIGGLVTSGVLFLTLEDRQADRHFGTDGPKVGFWALIKGQRRLLPPLMGFIGISVVMSAALQTYLPILLTGEGETLWLASVSLAVMQAAGVAGAMVGGTLSDRIGRRWMLFAAMLPSGVLMLVFLAIAGAWRFPVLLLLGFASLSINPVVMAIVQESFPQNRALANGFYMAFSFVVRSGVVLLLGWLGDAFGMHLAFTVTAVATLLAVPLVLILPEKATPADGQARS